MKHLGDITKINGAKVPPVDVITGGSPCQDLSMAGKREGLAGERSGLFMEQIRIVKEMRENDKASGRSDEHIRPRFMVWENVAGAFSSNKGEDFRVVLEEIAKIADSNASIPRLETGKDGKQKWSKAGAIMGDGWSIAWRLHDAQFWGVPQRRKRISLVADFGGESAPEILFERKGMSRDTEESRKEGQGVTTDVERGIEKAISFQERAGKPGGGKGILIQDERTGALSTLNNQPVCYGISSYDSNAMKSDNPHSGVYVADASRTLDLNGGNPGCNQGDMAIVQGFDGFNLQKTDDLAPTLMCQRVDTKNVPMVMKNNTIYSIGHDIRSAKLTEDEITDPLTATDYKDPIKILDNKKTYQDITGTLDCDITKGTNNQLVSSDMFVANTSVVRRLTPLECERLQGFPDGWTDIGEWYDSKGKKHKDADSPRYKALGNSIALPFWQWMAKRMVKYMDEPTMASLFDGIGGFPLVFSRVGVTSVWASEIEEFPMAVTKLRFPEKKYHVRRNKNV